MPVLPALCQRSALLDEDTSDADQESLSIEGGDRILATSLLPPPFQWTLVHPLRLSKPILKRTLL
jgi:hypothetical protein